MSDADVDSDNDGISNIDELKLGSSPSSKDTDMDGLDDGYEVKVLKTSPIKADTDGDGLDDYEETKLGLDPLKTATNGTPDRERIIKQVIPADDPIFREINTSDNAYALSIEIKASGYAKRHLIVRDSSYSYALQDSFAIGFTPEFIYDDDYRVESITLKFEIKEEFRDNVSHYFDALNSGNDYYDYTYEIDSALDGIKRFNVFKYFQSINLPMPICTEYDVDNNIVSVTVDTFETDDDGNSYGIGSYSLVDLEVWGMLMNEVDDNTSSAVIDTQKYTHSVSSTSHNTKIKKNIKEIDDSVRDLISKNYQSYNARKAVKTGELLGTGTNSISSLFGHRYAYYEKSGISYADAFKACQEKGGHLLTVTSPFEYSYLSGTLSSGKSGLYWVGASGGPNHWSWVTSESTSYARTISAYGYTMDTSGTYFSKLGNCLAYCPGLAYNTNARPTISNIKGYICEWEPGATITDTDDGIFSASIAGSTIVMLKSALSASSNIDSDNDGILDWKEIDHKAIEKLGGKTSDVSVVWKNAQKYINNVQKLAGNKPEELSEKIASVYDGNKSVTPVATNPGDDDSDGDGYKDKFDPRPNINDIYVTKLSDDYIMIDYSTVDTSDKVTWENKTAESGKEHISYGGAQGWFRGLKNDVPDDDKREYLVNQGCGLIAMADLALYLARYFGEGISLDPRDKDSVMQATSKWISELGEIGSTMRKDMDSVKAFLTKSTDEYRTPYGRASLHYPRMTSFVGTVNDEQFLIDQTGNRRFMTIPLAPDLVIDYNTQIKPFDALQLWSQIYNIVKDADKSSCFRLAEDEKRYLEKRNSAFVKPMKGEYEVLDILEEQQTPEQDYICTFRDMTVTEFIKIHNLKYDVRTVGHILKKYGYESKKKKINGTVSRVLTFPYKKRNYDNI